MLAAREHARGELQDKLHARGFSQDEIGRVLDHLERRGLLSDERFASEYAAMRVRKGYGPLRIRAELRERDVAPGLIQEALGNDRYDWRALLGDLNRSRFGGDPPADRKETAKRARFLAQRGFPESLVRELLLDRGL